MAVISSSAFCCWSFSFMGWLGTNCSPVLGSRCTDSSFREMKPLAARLRAMFRAPVPNAARGASICSADEK